MRTIKFFTLGCKVNQYETQVIREQFIQAGFKELEDSCPANIYVINTCTVTHRADSDSLNIIRRAKRENPKAKIVVTGCLTELDSDRIKEIKGVDLIVKNSDKDKLINFFNGQTGKWFDKLTIPRTIPSEVEGRANGITNFKDHTRVFLKIQDGCNNFCSYCKVPLVRGRSRSRPLDEIIQEANRLVKNGFKEIVLCGICLGSYGKDFESKIGLLDVIKALERIEGLLRIRLSSIEAGDVTDELIDRMAQAQKLCRHLHIPIQSGDDEILRKMNRNYRRADYLNLIKRIRKRIPEIAITTDILVGFPGENEINFKNTVDLIKDVMPLKVHIFPYSERQGTPAAGNSRYGENQAIIKERILRLKGIAEACAQKYKKQFLNKSMEVLIEGCSKDRKGFWEGYTHNYIRVLVKASRDLKNQVLAVKINRVNRDKVISKVGVDRGLFL